jgi:hypothetical protein
MLVGVWSSLLVHDPLDSETPFKALKCWHSCLHGISNVSSARTMNAGRVAEQSVLRLNSEAASNRLSLLLATTVVNLRALADIGAPLAPHDGSVVYRGYLVEIEFVLRDLAGAGGVEIRSRVPLHR